MMVQRKKSSYKFTDKTHPKSGIGSVMMAAAVFVVLVLLCFKSSESAGNGSILYGVAGIFCMFLSLGGFVLAMLCFKRQDIFYRIPTIGAVSNGIQFIVLFILYVLGMGL